jgi:hypothetical protein
VLVSRARRSREWRERLGAAETEVTWFAHELLPELRSSASLGEVAGGWRVGVARVTALEDELTVLGSSAPTESESHRAMELRAAVRLARDRLDALARAEDRPEWALDLDDVKAGLDTVLQPAPSDSVP